MRRLLIHIGYHRTGSTWLQSVVFDGRGPFLAPWNRGQIVRDLITVDPLRFDPGAARHAFAAGLAVAEKDGRIPVLTHEDLSGNPHAAGYNRREIAERLAEVFPEARVLMVIREQTGMILSCWKQYVRLGGANSLKNYMVAPWTKSHHRIPRFDLRFFEYDALIALYQKLFGRESVLVVPFELLRTDPYGFAAEIASFAGTELWDRIDTRPQYAGLSGPSCAVKRRLNLFLVRSSVNPAAPVYVPGLNGLMTKAFELVDPHLSSALRVRWDRRAIEYVDRVVGKRYLGSNRATAELTGLDLRDHGYDC
jgi:hypothetical protein